MIQDDNDPNNYVILSQAKSTDYSYGLKSQESYYMEENSPLIFSPIQSIEQLNEGAQMANLPMVDQQLAFDTMLVGPPQWSLWQPPPFINIDQ